MKITKTSTSLSKAGPGRLMRNLALSISAISHTPGCNDLKVLFIFIDGLGIGENNSDTNPFCVASLSAISRIFSESKVFSADACLGVSGLPQSATGQTAVFTGVNAPAMLGRHMSGQPTISLRNIIKNDNIFKDLLAMGFKVSNANAYREEYLDKMSDPLVRKIRPSVTSVMTMSEGVRFRTVDDYKAGMSIYHDITGEFLRDYGYDVVPISTEEAAERLLKITRENDFTLFEHFMTDIIGHKADMKLAVRHLELLDEFLGNIYKRIDLNNFVMIIASDHGNIEDTGVKTHTFNPVPVVFCGSIPEGIFDLKTGGREVKSLIDIKSSVIDIFKERIKHHDR